ncbi:MAG: Gfo/Idh/MocA family protein [Candidatus Cyclobacteriaceae bacterium M3_2C_046]
MKSITLLLVSLMTISNIMAQQNDTFKLAIAGLKHGHVNGFLNQLVNRQDVDLVGIYEKDKDLAQRIAQRFELSPDIFYTDLNQLLNRNKPEAVAIFSSTFDHLEIVEACARQKVDVMMEKPMAVNLDQAQQMVKLADQSDIELVVNYETTWYPTNFDARKVTEEKTYGPVNKIVVHSGHQGPKEIGVGPDFLEWLTDPVLNGGGAIMDFGCYGANLITWLMNNQEPEAVLAVTQQFKPDVYPEVDDEATIILTYPQAQGIIQASWNWPVNRKDMEIYYKNGYYMADNRFEYRHKPSRGEQVNGRLALNELQYQDPVTYLWDVVRGKITNHGLSGPENNLIVMKILDAAKRSAESGQKIILK